jgi:hypothetical protein
VTQNVLVTGQALTWMLWGAGVLVLFAVLLALRNRPSTLPGSSGHREKEGEGEHEVIRADGYIDSFAGVIEEAGGAPPPIVIVFFVGIWLWWLLYLVLNWTPH